MADLDNGPVRTVRVPELLRETSARLLGRAGYDPNQGPMGDTAAYTRPHRSLIAHPLLGLRFQEYRTIGGCEPDHSQRAARVQLAVPGGPFP